MTVADTSLDAYDQHIAAGKVGSQQAAVLRWLKDHPEATRSEIAAGTGMRLSSVCGRVNELVKLGMLAEGERRRCSETNVSAHTLSLAPAQMSLLP